MERKLFIKPDMHGPLIAYEYRPGHIYLNITNRCTNSCLFCSVRLNQGWLGPFNLNLAGLPRVPLRVRPQEPDKIYMPGLNIPEERKRACLWAEEESISQDSNNVHLAEQWMQDVLDAEPDVAATLAHLQTFMEREEVPLREVVFCGCGEPLIRLDHVLEISRVLKRQGVRIRVNTNGHAPLIHGLEVVDRLKGVVDAVSISLNAQDALTYIRLSRPAAGEDAFEALLEFSEECVQAIGDVTLSMVYLGPEETAGMGFHLDVDACRSLAEKMGAAFRVR